MYVLSYFTLPVCNFPSNHAGPFGTTDFIWRNSSLESSPPTMVKPNPRIDFTRVDWIRSPTNLFGLVVKKLLLMPESKNNNYLVLIAVSNFK